ncbi:MAG: SRPBCC family protein [Acidimicrobiales bacterium]
MAVTTQVIPARPSAVWAVLADASRYAEWVLGAKAIRGQEGDWPRPGARFHHTVGMGPFRIRDNTEVRSCEPGRRLVLETRVRPWGVAIVSLELDADPGGTRVRMDESPIAPRLLRLLRPLLLPLTVARNQQALRRLGDIAADTETSDG